MEVIVLQLNLFSKMRFFTSLRCFQNDRTLTILIREDLRVGGSAATSNPQIFKHFVIACHSERSEESHDFNRTAAYGNLNYFFTARKWIKTSTFTLNFAPFP